jgi:chromosome segregation ATPase
LQNELDESRRELDALQIKEENQRLHAVQEHSSKDDLFKESQECNVKLKRRLEESNSTVQTLRKKQGDDLSRIKELEASKVNMDLALFKAREQLRLVAADSGSTMERLTKLQTEVEKRLNASEQEIVKHTSQLEAARTENHTHSESERRLGKAEKKIIELQGEKVSVSAKHDELLSVHHQADNRLKEALQHVRELERSEATLQLELKELSSEKKCLVLAQTEQEELTTRIQELESERVTLQDKLREAV